MISLQQRYAEHSGKVSDRWTIYLDIYQRIFAAYVDRPINFLEIGIQNGGSLEIWGRHFPYAEHLVGCDIDSKCALLEYVDERLSVIVGDATEDLTSARITAIASSFDIVIDDGSHTSHDIVSAFCRYFPLIRDDGIFVAEDLHCSYWKQFGGGLFDPGSSIAFFKRLVDVVNHEHWGIPAERGEILRAFFGPYGCSISDIELAKIHSIEFINSVCVVRKRPAAQNELGPRIFVGSADTVSSERLALPAGKIPAPDQTGNPWSFPLTLPEEHMPLLHKELEGQLARVAEQAQQMDVLRGQYEAALKAGRQQAKAVADLQIRQAAMENSTSWRMTAPMRSIASWFSRKSR